MSAKPSSAIESASPAASIDGAPGHRLDRRALLRAGAGAAPVLMTLASGPVAAANSCVVASSFVSVATFKSRNPTTTVMTCATKTCEDWRSTCSQKPMPTVLTNKVSAYLGGVTTSPYSDKQLHEVLRDGAGIMTAGELGVLQHLVTLKLCITTGAVSSGGLSQNYITAAYLSDVWQNYKANGNRYRLPTAGIDWDSSALISWLRYQIYPIAV